MSSLFQRILPDAQGSEMFAQITRRPDAPVVCVLRAMTSSDHDRVEDDVRMITLGAKDTLFLKPLSNEEILNATRQLFGGEATGERAS